MIFEGLKAQVGSIPSPSSSMQTRYDESSIGGASGRLVKSIPLLSYNVGKLSVPVSLNHFGNAVKINQISGWVGINWDLEAGGVITRVVNDYPDEKATERIFFDEIESQGANLQGSNYLEEDGDTRDYRVDIFSFSFSGYSGSFYLDENFVPILMDNDSEMKIEFVGGINATDDNTIKITTPDGNMYYFGGVNASEYSSTLVNVQKQGTITYDVDTGTYSLLKIGKVELPLAATSFYLFKIENIFGDQILFDYLDEGTKNHTLYERQELPIVYESNELGCYDMGDDGSFKKALCKVTIHHSRKLEKIYSPSSELEMNFVSSSLLLPATGSVPTPQYDGRKLDAIELYDNNIEETIKNISFEYLLPNGANSFRFFLEKVNINNSDNSSSNCNSYEFEYKNPSGLPDRFSYEIDLLGFYNGAANTVLLASEQSDVYDNSFNGLAVRESNFDYASLGVLEKIIYPTGGYDKFEYESPQIRAFSYLRKTFSVFRNRQDLIANTVLSKGFSIGETILSYPSLPQETNPVDQDMILPVSVYVQDNGIYAGQNIIVEVTDFQSNTVDSRVINLVQGVYEYTEVFSFHLLAGKSYSVVLKFDPNSNNSGYATVTANAAAYYIGYDDFTALGIRAKSVSSYDSDDSLLGYKRFYYKKIENIGKTLDESAVVTFDANQQTEEEEVCCESGVYEVMNLIADPLNYYFANGDNQISYKYVTTSFGGDNFENGGIQQTFYVDEEIKKIDQYLYGSFTEENLNIDFGTSFSNSGQPNGQLLNTKVYKKDESLNLFLQEETNYTYNIAILNEIENFVVKRVSRGCFESLENSLNPAIGHYSNYSFSNQLVSVETKEYAFDQVGDNQEMSQTTIFEYGTLKGVISKKTIVDSKGNSQIIEYKYPTDADIATMPFDANYISAYNALKDRNIVVPIETIHKYKYATDGTEKLVSKSATLFKQMSNNNFVVPEKGLSAKASNSYEGNIEYTLYDDKGNLLEVTQENTFKKSYLYGYNDKIVIAEINNKAYNDISPTMISNLKDLSNNVVDDASMNAFKAALDGLRNTYPESMIATYVYDKYKLLRITTDARGENVYQDYDDCKRLKMVRDNSLNVVKEYQYNLNQN